MPFCVLNTPALVANAKQIIGLEGLFELKWQLDQFFFSQATRSEIMVYTELKVQETAFLFHEWGNLSSSILSRDRVHC